MLIKGLVVILILGTVFSLNTTNELCLQSLYKLQDNFGYAIRSEGASCSDFASIFTPNGTMFSPAWEEWQGADALTQSCQQFTLPEEFRNLCTQDFGFVYVTSQAAVHDNKMWCTGTGVFTISITNSTGSTCLIMSQETDTIIMDLDTMLFEYVNTIYATADFYLDYLKCGETQCQ